MKRKLFLNRHCLYFSHWSKKGYSIFAGLGCEVRISQLAIHMYENVLLKAASNGVIINEDQKAEITTKLMYLQQSLLLNLWMGRVCPDGFNDVFQDKKGYIAEEGYIPFLIKLI